MGAWLVTKTGHAVEERADGTLVTFAPDEASAGALVDELGRTMPAPTDTTVRRLDAVDWSTRWRDGLGPRQFGRLTVMPSWIAGAGAPGPYTVVLDPESAFGSGEHGSTRAALVLLERHLAPGSRVLDLGSGSGILAIAAAQLGASLAIGLDNDVEANPVGRRNAERNGVGESVDFFDGEAADLAPLLGPADLILSNILRTANTELLPTVAAALRPGGLAIFSGMEIAEAPEFRAALVPSRLEIRDEVVDSGWWAVAAVLP